jgi:hypothetical protein
VLAAVSASVDLAAGSSSVGSPPVESAAAGVLAVGWGEVEVDGAPLCPAPESSSAGSAPRCAPACDPAGVGRAWASVGGTVASGSAAATGVAERAAGESPCVVTGKACPIHA